VVSSLQLLLLLQLDLNTCDSLGITKQWKTLSISCWAFEFSTFQSTYFSVSDALAGLWQCQGKNRHFSWVGSKKALFRHIHPRLTLNNHNVIDQVPSHHQLNYELTKLNEVIHCIIHTWIVNSACWIRVILFKPITMWIPLHLTPCTIIIFALHFCVMKCSILLLLFKVTIISLIKGKLRDKKCSTEISKMFG